MSKGFHIQVTGKPVFTLVVLLMIGNWSLFGQHTVSIGTQSLCENNDVLIPVNVSNFSDVAAFTFFITIDTLLVKYVSLENPHTQLGGTPLSNFIDQSSKIAITWSSLSALNIAEGKLFDLKMNYFEGDALLDFTDQCEVATSSGLVVADVVYENGLLVSALQISEQPVSVTVTEGELAQFSISLLYEGSDFQWQLYSDDSWNDLQNSAPFSGVNTEQLTIVDVPVAFNNYAFRCNVSFEDCFIISDSVTLTVSPLMVVNSEKKNATVIWVSPNPCYEELNYVVNPSITGFDLQLMNIIGEVVTSERPSNNDGNFRIEHLHPGIYFLRIITDAGSVETVKVVKK